MACPSNTTNNLMTPGHYIQEFSLGSTALNAISDALLPGFVGAAVNIGWRDLEPTEGVYDFTLIDQYLNWGAANNRQVIIRLDDRDFAVDCAGNRAVPPYINAAGFCKTFPNQANGSLAYVWDPYVVSRKALLFNAIGAAYDTHPNFEALILQETGTGGISPSNTPGFSFDGYLTQIKNTITAAVAALPTTSVIQYSNGGLGDTSGGRYRELLDHIIAVKAGGVGLPDILPWNPTKTEFDILANEYFGDVLFVGGGDTSHQQQPGVGFYNTMADLAQLVYDFTKDTLGGQYKLWRADYFNSGNSGGNAVSGPPYSTDYWAAIQALVANAANTLSTDVPTSICTDTVVVTPCAGNLILNADFSETTDWQDSNDGVSEFVGGEYHISGTAAVTPFNQLYQAGISVTAGQTYEVSFVARAVDLANSALTVHLLQHVSPFANLGLNQAFNVTATNATYTATFTATASEANARFRFRFTAGEFYIDDVCLAPPVTLIQAAFTPAPTTGTTNTIFSFTNESTATNGVTSVLWDFGDGVTSTLSDPTHTFAATGTYTVSLTATGPDGTSTVTQDIVVTTPPVIQSAFTPSTTATTLGSSIVFTDASTSTSNQIDTYQWSFGDGNTSTAQSPTHTYTAVGTYTVSLAVSGPDGISASSQTVTISAVPVITAAFTPNPTTTTAGSAIAFTDTSTSTNGITTYLWNFGDGVTSTAQSPSHTYTAAGTYPVSLTVTGPDGTSSVTRQVVITAAPVINAAFTPNITSGTTNSIFTFTDNSTSTNGISTYAWDFGDGSTSTVQSPSHTFAATGTYTVSLTVTGPDGTDTVTQQVVVALPPEITASFTPSSTTPIVGTSVAFTDTSTSSSNQIDTYQWDFGDGTTSNQVSPSHTYANVGTYTVLLSVSGPDGISSASQQIIVSAVPVITSSFAPSATSAQTGAAITFANNSTATNGITSYAWNFGDGTTSTDAEPSHTFTAAGTYTVTLTVNGPDGTSTSTEQIIISTVAVLSAPNATHEFVFNSIGVVTQASSHPKVAFDLMPDTDTNLLGYYEFSYNVFTGLGQIRETCGQCRVTYFNIDNGNYEIRDAANAISSTGTDARLAKLGTIKHPLHTEYTGARGPAYWNWAQARYAANSPRIAYTAQAWPTLYQAQYVKAIFI